MADLGMSWQLTTLSDRSPTLSDKSALLSDKSAHSPQTLSDKSALWVTKSALHQGFYLVHFCHQKSGNFARFFKFSDLLLVYFSFTSGLLQLHFSIFQLHFRSTSLSNHPSSTTSVGLMEVSLSIISYVFWPISGWSGSWNRIIVNERLVNIIPR